MDGDELNRRLSQISTQWSMVFDAHGGEADRASAALARLAQRYSGAVYRYLLGTVRDPDAATDLSQELLLRILRGRFHQADPSRGRFRDYLKTALIHLIDDHRVALRSKPRPLPSDVRAPSTPSEAQCDADFLESWRSELLSRAWKALAAAQPMYYNVLLFRVENPDVRSPQMAEELGKRLGTRMRADQVRKAVQRAQARFALLLVDEVAASLSAATRAELEEELRELDLLKYCRRALEHRH
jgi:RNA polymerase sigma-70 factor (ECF subfamily)